MPQKTSPFVETKFGWSFGENGWNIGMDENLVKFSFLFDRNIDGIVDELPIAQNGKTYYLTTDKRFYFVVDSTYYSSPVPKWFQFVLRTTGEIYQFNGTDITAIPGLSEIDLRLDDVEVKVTGLGTAAYLDADSLVATTELAPSVNNILSTEGARSILNSFQVISSISELKLLLKTSVSKHAFVTGYLTDGDGGGGPYYLDESDNSTPDDGGTVIVASDGGRWKLKHNGSVSVEQFGCLAVPGRNNLAYLQNAISVCHAKTLKLTAGSGVFEYAGTLDLGYPQLSFQGAGMHRTIFKCTSANRAVDILGDRPNNGAYSFSLYLSDMCFEGNASTTDLLRIRINHPNLRNINLRELSSVNGCALRVEGTVAGYYENIFCSTNAQLMASRPLLGLMLDVDPTDQRRASCNTFVNLVIEGMMADGIRIIAGDQNTFIGGTSENNDGNGVTLNAGAQINTFIGVGFENRGYADIYDEGQMNKFINCYGNHNAYIGASSRFSKIEGGYFEKVEVAAAASKPTISGIRVKFFGGTGGLVTNNNQTLSVKDIYDDAAGVYIYPKIAGGLITVGASPFQYTNNSGRTESVTVTDGTVSSLQITRDGVVVAGVPLPSTYTLQPGDGLLVTYTAAPQMIRMLGM